MTTLRQGFYGKLEDTLNSERTVSLIALENSQLFMAAVLVSLPNIKVEPVVAMQNVGCFLRQLNLKQQRNAQMGLEGLSLKILCLILPSPYKQT